MNTPNVHSGRLERRVSKEKMPGFSGFCSFYPFGAICGVPLLRPRDKSYRAPFIYNYIFWIIRIVPRILKRVNGKAFT